MLLMLVYHDLFLFMMIVLIFIHELSSSSLISPAPSSNNKPVTDSEQLKDLKYKDLLMG